MSLIQHTMFQGYPSFGSGDDGFGRALLYISMAAILVI